MTIKIIDSAHPNGIAYRSFAEAGLTKFVNGYSMHFASGSNALVNAGNRAAFEYTDAFSLTGWLWLDAGTTSGTIISRMGADRGWKLYLDSSYLTLDLIRGVGDQLSGYAPTKVWDEDGFYFWGVTYDGSNAASTGLKFYLTGALDGCTVNDESVSGSIVESNVDLIIGDGFDGYLDEIGFWRGVLTLPEMENLYITQIPKHLGRFASPDSSRLIHYFRMGDSYLAPDKIIDEVTGGYATIVNATRETDVPEPFTPDPPPPPVGPPAPTSYWKFDAGPWNPFPGPNFLAVDTTDGNPLVAQTVVATGAPVPVGWPMAGVSLSAAGSTYFKGSVPYAAPAGFTIQFWLRAAPQPPNSGLLMIVDAGFGSSALLRIHAQGPLLYATAFPFMGGTPIIIGPLSSGLTGSYHIVEFDPIGAFINYRLNGGLKTPVSIAPLPGPYSGSVDIGLFGQAGGAYITAEVDEMAFWVGMPLSDTDASYIWNGGIGNPLI